MVAQFLIVSGLIIFILSIVYMVGTFHLINERLLDWKSRRHAANSTTKT